MFRGWGKGANPTGGRSFEHGLSLFLCGRYDSPASEMPLEAMFCLCRVNDCCKTVKYERWMTHPLQMRPDPSPYSGAFVFLAGRPRGITDTTSIAPSPALSGIWAVYRLFVT